MQRRPLVLKGAHPLLELALEVHPRHHFLAGVAAFLEADAAEHVVIQHLGQEQVLAAGEHLGLARQNVLEAGAVAVHQGALGAQRLPVGAQQARRRHQQRHVRMGVAQHGDAVAVGALPGAGHRQAGLGEGAVDAAAELRHRQFRVRLEIGLGAQFVFLEAAQGVVHPGLGHHQQVAAGHRRHPGADQPPALQGKVHGQPLGAFVDVLEVGGDLSLQIVAGFVAGNADHRQVVAKRQRRLPHAARAGLLIAENGLQGAHNAPFLRISSLEIASAAPEFGAHGCKPRPMMIDNPPLICQSISQRGAINDTPGIP